MRELQPGRPGGSRPDRSDHQIQAENQTAAALFRLYSRAYQAGHEQFRDTYAADSAERAYSAAAVFGAASEPAASASATSEKPAQSESAAECVRD